MQAAFNMRLEQAGQVVGWVRADTTEGKRNSFVRGCDYLPSVLHVKEGKQFSPVLLSQSKSIARAQRRLGDGPMQQLVAIHGDRYPPVRACLTN